MSNELAPGVLALVVGLHTHTSYNGKCVELKSMIPANQDWYYDPVDCKSYYFPPEPVAWWVCVASDGEVAMYLSKNLMPIGEKKDEELNKEVEKDNELCKST